MRELEAQRAGQEKATLPPPSASQNMCGTGATIDFLSNVSFTGRKEGGAQETLTEGTYGAS